MLITMLKGRKRAGAGSPARKDRARATVVDISGPLPQRAMVAAERKARADERSAAGTVAAGTGEMSNLPRELDPFESDFPWIGWTEPRHETFVSSDSRSPTFDRDLQRVLSIFEN